MTPAAAQVGVNISIGTPPPAPIFEAVPAPRVGYVWAPGFWRREHERHVWAPGHWIAARPGHRWVSTIGPMSRGRTAAGVTSRATGITARSVDRAKAGRFGAASFAIVRGSTIRGNALAAPRQPLRFFRRPRHALCRRQVDRLAAPGGACPPAAGRRLHQRHGLRHHGRGRLAGANRPPARAGRPGRCGGRSAQPARGRHRRRLGRGRDRPGPRRIDGGRPSFLLAPPFDFKGCGDEGPFDWIAAVLMGLGPKASNVILDHIPQVTMAACRSIWSIA